MLYIVFSFFTGCLVIISMIINSHLSQKIGIFQGALINYIVGLLFAFLLLGLKNNFINISFGSLLGIPIWAYLGGVLGVIVIAISNIIIPKIPTIYTTLIIFVGQLFSSITIDYFRGILVSKGKIFGGFLILVGLIYNFSIDKKVNNLDTKENCTICND